MRHRSDCTLGGAIEITVVFVFVFIFVGTQTLVPSTTVTQLARKAIDYGERTQNKGYYAGHSRSSRMVSVENPSASITSYLVPFRSYRSLLFNFSTLRVLQPPFGELTSVNWTFFARCYGWGATSEYRLKIDISLQRRPFDQKISGRRGRPPPTILLLIKLGYMIFRML